MLDVGGTAKGFRANADLPEGTELVVVNPTGPPDAQYKDIKEIPANDPGFDFAMLFGVLMYGDRSTMVGLLREIRRRLRGTHSTLLVAEPDPVSLAGFPDAVLKFTFGSLARMAGQGSWKARFHIYSRADAQAMLFEAGFGIVERREDLNPKLLGPIPRLPVYYVLAASI
ncbi:MAG: hypothetical protein ABSC95_27005 [Acetobacteraceae bacterium]